MAEPSLHSQQLLDWLERLRAGDEAVRNELLQHVCGRLERLTRKMLKGFPAVKRWSETGDVLQNAILRLLRALESVDVATTRDFFSLAALQIRRELLDLARQCRGPFGLGKKFASVAGRSATDDPLAQVEAETEGPDALAEWCEFHERISQLADDQREVVDLLFYQGLTQLAAARLLGLSVRTVQRRWQAAMLSLHDFGAKSTSSARTDTE